MGHPKWLLQDRKNIRIPATPTAPASPQSATSPTETPPKANNGIPALQASRSASNPTPGTTSAPSTHFPNTGPNRTASAPPSRARTTSASEWHETLTNPSGLSLRTCKAVNSPSPPDKFTPSAPTASATSTRPATSIRVPDPRTAPRTSRQASANSPACSCFSRTRMNFTPSRASSAHRLASAPRPSRPDANDRVPSVMAYRFTSTVYGLRLRIVVASNCMGLVR